MKHNNILNTLTTNKQINNEQLTTELTVLTFQLS